MLYLDGQLLNKIMSKPEIIQTRIKSFNGGMVNDPRDPRANISTVLTNFDALTDDYRLKPYRDSETGDSLASTAKIANFCIAKLSSTPTYALYGLGIASTGTNVAQVYNKRITTGASNDLDDGDWTATANQKSSTNNSGLSPECFVYYEKQGLIYMVDVANDQIMAYDPDGGTAWDESSQALTCTNVAQGLVHSKDDVLYIPYYNSANGTSAIASKDGAGAWNLTAITLPAHLRIRMISEYGNYIAIACEPVSGAVPGFGGSVVFLWDRDTSLETLSDSISWGSERLLVLEEINGTLIGISVATGTTRFERRLVFRYLLGSEAVKFEELTSSSSNLDLISFRQKINNRLYFLAEITIDGESRDGVWSVGGRPGSFSIFHERTPNNNGTFTDLELKAFHFVGDYLFISYADNGTYAMTKTNDTASYTATSIYERMFVTKDSATTKKLLVVTVMFEPLPTAGQVVLKYKKDAESSWTTIFTYTTDNGISHSAINIESSGANLGQYKELKLRIESTGGAVITGLKFKEEIINNDLY